MILTARFHFRDVDWGEQEAEGHDKRFVNKQATVSTRCLLASLLVWACTVENDAGAMTPMRLMQGLLNFCTKNCALKSYAHVVCMEEAGGNPYAAEVEGGRIKCLKDILHVAPAGSERELSLVLTGLMVTKDNDRLLADMLVELAHAIEDALPLSGWLDCCQSVLPAIIGRRAVNPKLPLDIGV